MSSDLVMMAGIISRVQTASTRPARGNLDAVDDGYAAYCGLTIAEWFRARKEPDSVQRMASHAMD